MAEIKQENASNENQEPTQTEEQTVEPKTETNGEQQNGDNETKKADDEEGGELIMAKAFVWNLPPKTTVEELTKLFEPYGPITKCDVVKRWGFVHLTEQSELERAIKELDQTEFKEFTISVKQSRAKDPNKKPKAGEKKKGGAKRVGEKAGPKSDNNRSRDGYRRAGRGSDRSTGPPTHRMMVRDKARKFARIVNHELRKMQGGGGGYGGGFDGPNGGGFGGGYGGGNWGGFGGRSGPWANGNGPNSMMNRGFDNGPWSGGNGGMGGNFGGSNFNSNFGCGDFGRRNGGYMDDFRGGNMNRGNMMDRFSGNGGGWSRRK